MYKILPASKDTYITNKVISGDQSVSSSAGYASTLDLFKLYGATTTLSGNVRLPNTEISRALIGFNIQDVASLFSSGVVDLSDSRFKCTLKLFDVYGGQPTPANFTISVFPLSRSFEEGKGKDIVYFTDIDVANFLSTSRADGAWYITGANKPGDSASATTCDYFSSINGTAVTASQYFENGNEDLSIDMTQVLSATLAGELPRAEYRISFESSLETDQQTYFVKRFGSRHIHDASKRPQLVVKYPDMVLDTAASMQLGVSGTLFLYNETAEGMSNVVSASQQVTGSNCLILELSTGQVSGGYSAYFTGSQFTVGNSPKPGMYYADVYIPSLTSLSQVAVASGSVSFTPTWKSLDGSVAYLTGSTVEFKRNPASTSSPGKKRYVVTAYGLPSSMKTSEKTLVRVNTFDVSDPLLTVVKSSVELVNKVPRRAYYSVRCVDDSTVVFPFDKEDDSTRLSTDANGCYFQLDASSLAPGRSYVVDVLIVEGQDELVYTDVSPIFRVT